MKRIRVLLFCFLLIFIGVQVYADTSFTDVKDTDWFKGNLDVIVEKGIISGYPDGTFRPQDTLKFEEFIKMLILSVSTEGLNTDVDGEWYEPYMDLAIKRLYITKEYRDWVGTEVTRNTMAEILYNVLSRHEEIKSIQDDEKWYLNKKFRDLWNSYEKLTALIRDGFINGYSDKTVKPKKLLTRAEVTTVIRRYIDKDLRVPMKIDLEEFAYKELANPEIVVVYNNYDFSFFGIYISNYEYFSDTAEFRIEFPNNPELYKYEIPKSTGEYYTEKSAGIWRLNKSEGILFCFRRKNDINESYASCKEKLEKIKRGYELDYTVLIRDTIGGKLVEKTINCTEKLDFDGVMHVNIVK